MKIGVENLVRVADQAELYLEWSVNEKVAQETASSSFAGLWALCAMKQNGVHVASDFLLHLAGSGVRNGLVLISCDPGALSGINEGESRHFARIMYHVELFYVMFGHYLGQSGRVFAEELGVSPQAVYAASSRVELEDWTRKSWKDGAGKIYCINWQRKGGKEDGKGDVRAECA